MRVIFAGTPEFARAALEQLLAAGFTVPLVLTHVAAPSAAFSQTSVCHSIRAGETATHLARRLTGDGRNK